MLVDVSVIVRRGDFWPDNTASILSSFDAVESELGDPSSPGAGDFLGRKKWGDYLGRFFEQIGILFGVTDL